MKKYLLPYPLKYAGALLLLSGILMAVLYFWFDFRFTIPVFAVHSAFIETKMFVMIRTNFADEMVLLLHIAGLGLVVFSKEKQETENMDSLRLKSLSGALAVNTIFLFLSVLLVFGSGFITILVLNLYSFSFFYLLFFYFLKNRSQS